MLKLWLARHGEAVDPDLARSDFHRTLTETGRQQLTGLTRWLIDRVEPPELILHSPLVRAQQTAETIAAEIGTDIVTVRLEEALSRRTASSDIKHGRRANRLRRTSARHESLSG